AAEGCDVEFDWCEIHHLHPWEKGGPTDLGNLAPLCSYHHHWVHECGIEPQIQPDRTLRMVPIPLTPAPQRRRARDLTMGTSPPDLVPTRG
ncbi:MAG TPA: HNH endonuclease signature motif containing protein, partial [Acidimicrobiales bacterium]